MEDTDTNPAPQGELMLRTYATPKDTNGYGNVYAGWILSQMDLAAAAAAEQLTHCRVVTVSVAETEFVAPIRVGSLVCMHTKVQEVGRSSITVRVEAWAHRYNEAERHKVTESTFIVVAVDEQGRSKTIQTQ